MTISKDNKNFKYRSLVIHSLNTSTQRDKRKSRVQSAQQFPEHQTSARRKQEIKMSGGFKALGKETKLTAKDLFNCRYSSLQQREQTKSSLSVVSPRQTFWRSGNTRKNKEHKEKQLKTL